MIWWHFGEVGCDAIDLILKYILTILLLISVE